MSDQRVYLDDIYASKECQGSVFRAVVMMAHEARFLNNQAGQGYIQLNKKPTTIAMYKFKEGKLSMIEKGDKLTILSKEEAEARKLEKEAEIQKVNAEAKPAQDSASALDAANDAFGI